MSSGSINMKLKTLQFILLLIFTTSVSAITLICKGDKDNLKEVCSGLPGGCPSSTAFSINFDSKKNLLVDVTQFLYCKKGSVHNIEIDSTSLGFDCYATIPFNGKSEHYINRISGKYGMTILDRDNNIFSVGGGQCQAGKKLF